jgi:hypothetical protein
LKILTLQKECPLLKAGWHFWGTSSTLAVNCHPYDLVGEVIETWLGAAGKPLFSLNRGYVDLAV